MRLIPNPEKTSTKTRLSIFMCTNLAFIPLVYFCYPETSNLTLEVSSVLCRISGTDDRHHRRKSITFSPPKAVTASIKSLVLLSRCNRVSEPTRFRTRRRGLHGRDHSLAME